MNIYQPSNMFPDLKEFQFNINDHKSPEQPPIISFAKGHRFTEESKERARIAAKKRMTPEAKVHLSKVMKENGIGWKPLYGKNNGRSKRILCIETGVIYDTIKDCCINTGMTHTAIWKWCTGKVKSTKSNRSSGLSFCYYSD